MNDCNAEARLVMFLCDDVMVVVFVWAFVVIYSDYRCMCVMAAVTSSINQTTHKPHSVGFASPWRGNDLMDQASRSNGSRHFWEIRVVSFGKSNLKPGREIITTSPGLSRRRESDSILWQHRQHDTDITKIISNQGLQIWYDIDRPHSKKWHHCSPT